MLIEVAALSFVLAASSQRCGVGERTFSVSSAGGGFTITAKGSKEPNLLHSATLEDALAMDLSLVSDIRYVSIERADDNLLVWIALDHPTRDNRERVFQKQFNLIEGFPEISFDFNLISSGNRAPREFLSDGKLIYSREDK